MNISTRFGFAALFVALFSGCMGPQGPAGPQGSQGEQGVPGQNGEDGGSCMPTPSTFLMIHEWAESDAYFWSCWGDTDLEASDCIQAAGADQVAVDACFTAQQVSERRCYFYRDLRINKIPLRECGVAIIEMAPDAVADTYQSLGVNMGDEDGDGVPAYWEFVMGQNPCTAHSFGECVDDGSLDYDADGMSNADDPEPLCNPEDPGHYQSDCV